MSLKKLVRVIVTYTKYTEMSVGCGGKSPSNQRVYVLGCD